MFFTVANRRQDGLAFLAMIAVEAVTEIEQDRTLRIGLPQSVKPRLAPRICCHRRGHFGGGRQALRPVRLAKLSLAGWPADSTFRREDIYGDTGR